MFLFLLSSGEDGVKKNPNFFGCDFKCIQIRLGFLFEFLIFIVYGFISLLPDGSCLFCGSQFLLQPLVVSVGDNAVDRIAFERIGLIWCERNISGDGIFLAHRFNILHRQRNGLCRLGFPLQSFQSLFLFLRGSFGILQTLLGLCHLSIILQSQSQLKAIYKDNADTIVGNCDTTLFLGGKEKTTLKEMSEILGKETIDSFNTSETRGRELSHGLNFQKLGKELMTQDEIAVMDGGKCILQVRGVRPFFSDKYNITKHPNYKYLSDFDKKNAFDMEKELKRRPAIVKPDEVFDYYEVDAAALQEDTP